MSANELRSVAAYRPANLVAVVLTDGQYSITGGQPLPVDRCFADVAGALPGLTAARVSDGGNLRDALLEPPRPALVEAVVRTGSRPGPSPFVDPGTVRTRFTAALRATAGADGRDTGQEVTTCTADR